MKKKLMFLALGVVAVCSVAFSQVNVTGQVVNGTTFNGTVAAPVVNGSVLAIGTRITYHDNATNQDYTFQVVQTPSSNPTQFLADMSNAIGNAFDAVNVKGSGGIHGVNVFGSDINLGNYALQAVVPFDFGLSAVLGMGAIAAVTAARRKKEQQLAV